MNAGEDGLLADTLHAAPTASRRRIQQSLTLANRLQAKQKEVEELKGEVGRL
jgi:hypothetical protein